MKTQKTSLLVLTICLFTGINSFSQDQKREKLSSEALFNKLDKNNDEVITKDEVGNDKISKRFDKIDANADGGLTMEELKFSIDNRKKNKTEKGKRKNPEKLFKKLDKNQDGNLSKDEIEGKKFEKRFDRIDKDNNDLISLEELKTSLSKNKSKKNN